MNNETKEARDALSSMAMGMLEGKPFSLSPGELLFACHVIDDLSARCEKLEGLEGDASFILDLIGRQFAGRSFLSGSYGGELSIAVDPICETWRFSKQEILSFLSDRLKQEATGTEFDDTALEMMRKMMQVSRWTQRLVGEVYSFIAKWRCIMAELEKENKRLREKLENAKD